MRRSRCGHCRDSRPATTNSNAINQKGVTMIYEYLQEIGAVGADRAVYQAELAKRFGTSRDSIKQMVSNERRQGLLTCSNGNGYFLPANREEMAQFAAREDATANTHRQTAKLFHEALKAQDGQLDMFMRESDNNG